MTNKSKPLFIVAVGLLLALGRYLLDSISLESVNDEFILLIMAIINYIAFSVVILFLGIGVSNKCSVDINETGVSTQIKKQRIKILNIVLTIACISLMIIFIWVGFEYLMQWKSAAWNDMLAIVALAISIANDGLVEIIGEIVCDFIIFLDGSKKV